MCTGSLPFLNQWGHPLAAPVSRAKPNFPCCFFGSGIFFCGPVCCFQANPFPHYWLRSSRACHPCGSSSIRCSGSALAQIAPEKRWCRQGVRAMITDLWLAFKRPIPQLAHPVQEIFYGCKLGDLSIQHFYICRRILQPYLEIRNLQGLGRIHQQI